MKSKYFMFLHYLLKITLIFIFYGCLNKNVNHTNSGFIKYNGKLKVTNTSQWLFFYSFQSLYKINLFDNKLIRINENISSEVSISEFQKKEIIDKVTKINKCEYFDNFEIIQNCVMFLPVNYISIIENKSISSNQFIAIVGQCIPKGVCNNDDMNTFNNIVQILENTLNTD